MKDPGLIQNDPWLEPYRATITGRMEKCVKREHDLAGEGTLQSFASGHLWFGIHRYEGGLIMREWAPNAREIYLLGDFNKWQSREDYMFS
ncbi:MAG: 1,4-alpha-glucan-branching enzyme, partial [Bacteroides sp.]|nr:1,4-alpha-glucan-branching enzyme [Bacteroides sp.]